jgi:cytochrome c oxidase subunit 2
MWHFAYADGRSALGTLTVPAGTPVRLVMTSRDVIHSFFVPAFRVKQDVIPGRYTTAWFEATAPGTYEVFCAEFCGLSHSRMRGQVTVLPRGAYAAWLARTAAGGPGARAGDAEAPTAGAFGDVSEMARRGREVAARRQCTACHTADGQRFVGPTWRGLYGSQVALRGGRTVLADEAYLTRSMMDPLDDVVAGFDPVMPAFRGVLEPGEVAALVEYIRSLARQGEPSGVALPAVLRGGVEQPRRPPALPGPADVPSDSVAPDASGAPR